MNIRTWQERIKDFSGQLLPAADAYEAEISELRAYVDEQEVKLKSIRITALEEAASLIESQRVMTLRPTEPCSGQIVLAIKASHKSLVNQIRRLKEKK